MNRQTSLPSVSALIQIGFSHLLFGLSPGNPESIAFIFGLGGSNIWSLHLYLVWVGEYTEA